MGVARDGLQPPRRAGRPAAAGDAAVAGAGGTGRDRGRAAAGASVAAQGGWFSDTMLDALRKYQLSARLAEQDQMKTDLSTEN